MTQGLFFRCVFIFNFWNVIYFSFLENFFDHLWCKEYVSRTPGSYRYTNSIELVPRFGLWPSPPLGTPFQGCFLEQTFVTHSSSQWTDSAVAHYAYRDWPTPDTGSVAARMALALRLALFFSSFVLRLITPVCECLSADLIPWAVSNWLLSIFCSSLCLSCEGQR